jgi:hypothetical protein
MIADRLAEALDGVIQVLNGNVVPDRHVVYILADVARQLRASRPAPALDAERKFGPCQKCHHALMSVTWIEFGDMATCGNRSKCPSGVEHFHVICTRCGYGWAEGVHLASAYAAAGPEA